MKAIIFGAGISGLTAAHELVEKGFSVDVYEKDSIPGGMARSINGTFPSEHSWRGYGPFYYNTFEMMSRIPIEKIHETKKREPVIIEFAGNKYDIGEFIPKHPGGTIINQLLNSNKSLEDVWKDNDVSFHSRDKYVLSILEKYKIENNNSTPNVNDNLTLLNEFILLDTPQKISFIDYPYLLYLFLTNVVSNKRRNYKDLLIKHFTYFQKCTKYYLLDFVCGPGYGFDKNTISTPSFFNFI